MSYSSGCSCDSRWRKVSGGAAAAALERRRGSGGSGGAECLTSAGGLSFKVAPLRDRAATV